MQGVSRAWNSFIQARPDTYKQLDFSTTQRYVSKFSLNAYINRSAGNVQEAVLGKYNDKSALFTIVNKCPRLSILKTHNNFISSNTIWDVICIAKNLTELSTDCDLYLTDFHAILKECASLHTLECGAFYESFAHPTEAPAKPFTNLRCLKVSSPLIEYTTHLGPLTFVSWKTLPPPLSRVLFKLVLIFDFIE